MCKTRPGTGCTRHISDRRRAIPGLARPEGCTGRGSGSRSPRTETPAASLEAHEHARSQADKFQSGVTPTAQKIRIFSKKKTANDYYCHYSYCHFENLTIIIVVNIIIIIVLVVVVDVV